MGKFLKFEKMITPIFIQIIFWAGLFALLLGGIGLIGYSFFVDSGGFFYIISGLLTMLIGPFILRIYCEIFIVLFKMQGSLIDIRDSLHQEPRQMRRRSETPQRSDVQTNEFEQMEDYNDQPEKV